MLSANLKIDRKDLKRRITWFNTQVWYDNRDLEIQLGLTGSLIYTTTKVNISLSGHLGRRLKTFLEAVYDRHGWWAANNQVFEFYSGECHLQGDLFSPGRHFTFSVPCISQTKLLTGDFTCTLRYTHYGWLMIETIGGEWDRCVVNLLAQGLDLNGWHLPNHWFQTLYKLLSPTSLLDQI